MSIISRMISADGSVVAVAADATDIVSEIHRIHGTSAVMSAALGRLAVGASLIGIGMKNEKDSLTLKVNGGGPAGTLIAVSDSGGNVRCCANAYDIELPLNAAGKLDVGRAVGKDGMLTVIKDIGMKEPYSGQIPLTSGEIAEDIAAYYAYSEQIPTVCALGVLAKGGDGSVICAGGYLVQLLPFADESCIDVLERNIKKLPPITDMLASGMDSQAIAASVLEGLEPQPLDSHEAEYRCTCSRQRIERALISIGEKDLSEMAQDTKPTEVCCHFCNAKYSFEPDDVKKLLNEARQG